MSDDQGIQSPLKNLPQWAQIVSWIGLPAALCIFLVWIVTGDLKAQVKQQTADIAAIKTTMARQADQAWIMLGVSQRICLNTSKTEEDKLACVSIAPASK